MKRIMYIALLAVASLGAASCDKDPKLPTPVVEDFPQIYTSPVPATVPVGPITIRLADVQGSTNPTFTFNLDIQGGDISQVQTIEIVRYFRGFNVPATGAAAVGLSTVPVLLRTVPPTSGTYAVTLNELVTGLTRATGQLQTGNRAPLTRASLRSLEGFIITYILVLNDGRRIEYSPTYYNAPFAGLVNIIT